MIKLYPAIFHHEEGSYWVSFPDLEGCFSDGDTLEEAMENAQEALALHLAVMLDHKDPIPEPSDIESVDRSQGGVSYVVADPDKCREKNKAVRKSVTVPQWLNEEAMARNINFSKVLQKALMQELTL